MENKKEKQILKAKYSKVDYIKTTHTLVFVSKRRKVIIAYMGLDK
jgi:hypothetical protein